MQIAIYISVTILLLIFAITSGLAINHARRFKHLSKRTLYLTYFYVGISTIMAASILILTFTGDW